MCVSFGIDCTATNVDHFVQFSWLRGHVSLIFSLCVRKLNLSTLLNLIGHVSFITNLCNISKKLKTPTKSSTKIEATEATVSILESNTQQRADSP